MPRSRSFSHKNRIMAQNTHPDWHDLPTPDFDSVADKGPRFMDCTWRDIALYVLGVDASKDDLAYIWEGFPEGMKALPTLAFVPYLNAIQLQPQRRVPYAPNELPGVLIIDALGGYIPNRLHMGVDLIMHKPIDSLCGKFLPEDSVEEVFDWDEKCVVESDGEDLD